MTGISTNGTTLHSGWIIGQNCNFTTIHKDAMMCQCFPARVSPSFNTSTMCPFSPLDLFIYTVLYAVLKISLPLSMLSSRGLF